MTERIFESLRLAAIATATTSICALAACAQSEPSRSAPATTPESSTARTAEPAPPSAEPGPASSGRAARPEQSPGHAGTQDPAPQGAPGAPPPEDSGAGAPPEGGASASVTDDEVEAFVEVQLDLESERRDLMAEAKQEDADVAELQRQLEQRAQELVEESPLSLTRFQKIGQRLMRDPALQERVRAAMDEQSGG